MAATLVILLSCLVYGIVANPPSPSYLPPTGSQPAERPIQIPVRIPEITIPAVDLPAINLPPSKGVGRRPSPIVCRPPGRPVAPGPVIPGPVIPGPVVPGPVVPGPVIPGPVIPGPIVRPGGGKRPVQRPIQRPVVPAPNPKSGYSSRTVGPTAPY